MKLKHVAIIMTALVIVAGFAMISPLFLRIGNNESKQKVMLSFSVSESADVIDWCQNLSSLLDKYNMGASVFIVGKVAEQYPQVVSYFSDKVDIGSQTYSNLSLTGIPDYLLKLQEVKEGKMAVDLAGSLYSRIFRAPFGATDQNIYSLLSRSGILADFSYENQYNVYQDGQFVKYDAITYMARDYSPDFFLSLSKTTEPVIIVFDNSYPISDIEVLISMLQKADVEFVNASEFTGLTLTIRGGDFVARNTPSN
jgi:peptidoglycan/xylan/chitin deacetylase (PgdA/CDA1 family)